MKDLIILWLAGFGKPHPPKNSIYFYADKDALQDMWTGEIWSRYVALIIAKKRLKLLKK